jgi:hypothetical protein
MILRSLFAFLIATVSFSMVACNNSEQTKSTNTGDSGTATTQEQPPVTPVSTVSTTPQNMLVIRHKVKDFAKWMAAYDADDTARMAAGIHSYVVGRGLQDSNMVLIAMKVDDTAKAMAFGKSPSLRAVMQKAGVIGVPNSSLVTMTYQDTASVNAPIRSVVSFTVKDWGVWQQNFEAGAQGRKDNGLA